MLYCIAENRQDCELGLRYLLVTFQHFCPNDRIVIYFPEPCDSFKEWVKQFPQAEHIPYFPVGGWSWTCKPQAILPLLERGEPEVVWLDSDIMLTGNPANEFSRYDSDTLIVAQEHPNRPDQGTEIRTKAWNLPVGRSLPWTLNSCVLRVTSHHISLLRRWSQLCNDPEYTKWSHGSFALRPIHMKGDQDVLSALVGSAEFADIPVHYLENGVDVIHSFGARGYPLDKRLAGMFRKTPTFIHGNGAKPWIVFHEDHVPKLRFYNGASRLIAEVSPYTALCRHHRWKIGLSTPWLDRHSVFGLFLRLIGLGNHSFRGLFITILATLLDRQ